MNDLIPVKRHLAMQSFSREHHFGLLLVWKIRQGLLKSIDPERISAYVLYFYKTDLEKHFKDEERLLFGKLLPDNDLRKQAEADHQAVYALVADLEHNGKDADLLRRLADRLEQHIRFEERQLFNHLQDLFSTNEMEGIGARLPNDSRDPGEEWEDKFWS
jgi:hemerythrin superfamily protein